MTSAIQPIVELWVYLSASPLLWLTMTIGVFLVALALARASGNHPLINPILLSICAIVFVLRWTETSYADYLEGAQFVHFALGPATVALGIPLYRTRRLIASRVVPISVALVIGAATGVGSAIGFAALFGLPLPLQAALAPKSVTAGIAMGVAEQIGADPTLTAVSVIATGIIGAMIVTPLMNFIRVRDYAARGFAAGLASHGIGTARALQVDGVAGAFAGLAMALNGLMTALLAPIFIAWLQ